MRQPEVPLEVPLGSRAMVSFKAKVDLPEKLLDEFGDEGLEWGPQATPGGLTLRSLTDGRSVALLPAPAKGEVVEYSFTRPKIQRNKPAEVTFTVPEPWTLREKLGPGVFRGELSIAIFHPSLMDGKEPLKTVVPVLLVLPGTRLLGAKFTSLEGKGPLRVGQRASVAVSLESFGGAPGAGRLELNFTRPSATASESLLRIPLPLGIPAWDPIESREGWACHPRWASVAIPEVEARAEPVAAPVPGLTVERHQFRAELPDLFQPGQVSGRVIWPTDPTSTLAPSKVVEIAPVAVASGLLAGPRVGMIGQPTQVYLIARGDELGDPKTWGETIPFDPGGPVGGTTPPLLRRVGPASGEEVVYLGEFYPARASTYAVTLGPGAPEKAREVLRPVEVQVPFQWGSQIPIDPPVTVFVDSTPWWWSIVYSSEQGNRDVVRRRGAMGLKLAWPGWRDLNVRLVGVYKVENGRTGDRLDPDRDPLVSFEPGGPSWPLKGTDPLRLDLVVDVRPPSPDPEHDRRRLRTETCFARWLIVGLDPAREPDRSRDLAAVPVPGRLAERDGVHALDLAVVLPDLRDRWVVRYLAVPSGQEETANAQRIQARFRGLDRGRSRWQRPVGLIARPRQRPRGGPRVSGRRRRPQWRRRIVR